MPIILNRPLSEPRPELVSWVVSGSGSTISGSFNLLILSDVEPILTQVQQKI